MTTELNAKGTSEEPPRWCEIGKLLIVAALVAVLLLLGTTMVHHRFFRGGRVDVHGVLRP